MPGFNGTGPRGLGPMTGGRRGFCTGYFPTPYPYYAPRPYPNYGFSSSYGPPYPSTTVLPTTPPTVTPYVRTPFGATFVPTYSKEQERLMLEQQVQMLESQIEALRKRLGELSK